MQIRADQLFTQARPVSRLGKIVQFPIVRILIAVLFLVPVLALDKAFRAAVYPSLSGNIVVVLKYIEAVIFFALFVVAYRLYAKHIEKRPALEVCFTRPHTCTLAASGFPWDFTWDGTIFNPGSSACPIPDPDTTVCSFRR